MRQEEFSIKDREGERGRESKEGRVKTAAFNPAKEQELDLLTGESVWVCVCVCVAV